MSTIITIKKKERKKNVYGSCAQLLSDNDQLTPEHLRQQQERYDANAVNLKYVNLFIQYLYENIDNIYIDIMRYCN